MNLAELDRDASRVEFDYLPWEQLITCRKLSALELVTLNHDFGELHGEEATSEALLGFYCEILSIAVVSPTATAEEWQRDVSFTTLMELGQKVCQAIGLTASEEKKSESNDRSPDSPATLRENSGGQM